MILGRIDRRKPLIPVTILDQRDSPHTLQVILDTGFDGDLTLPRGIIRQFGFVYRGPRTMVLADGSYVETECYAARVLWRDQQTEAIVFQSESEYLLGMSLLWDQRMMIDAVEGGRIIVEEIPSGTAPA